MKKIDILSRIKIRWILVKLIEITSHSIIISFKLIKWHEEK